MRIVGFSEKSIPISRYDDPSIPSGGLTTSIVALTTDVLREGRPVVGFGFSSIGRYGQGGLMRERFAPRLIAAAASSLASDDESNIDPFKAWNVMMSGEKPGGHGERCVAVGTLDMALWDAAGKIAGLPLYRLLCERLGRAHGVTTVDVYASGGYPYPSEDLRRLQDEIRSLLEVGHTSFKIKIGAADLARDMRRIEAVLRLLPSGARLAVDAMNAYDAHSAPLVAAELAPLGLRWFEDVCDPHDFATQSLVTASYQAPIAAGEALFSAAEAVLLDRYGGMRRDRDVLLFDPVHCYGVPGFFRIVRELTEAGWPRAAFWPHGGHLFTLHVAAAFGLAGSEINARSFAPFGGPGDDCALIDGRLMLSDAPGVGFEKKRHLHALFEALPK